MERERGVTIMLKNLVQNEYIEGPLWLAILYQLAWAIGSQCWQNFRYNRYARNHPWREQTQQQEENRYGI